MSKKKRKKNKHPHLKKQHRPEQPSATETVPPAIVQETSEPVELPKPKEKRNPILPVAGIAVVLIAVVILLYFGSASFRGMFHKSDSQREAYLYMPPRTDQTGQEIRYSDFVGSDSCMLCHIEQYTLWRNSTHGLAGGEPGNIRIVARFDNQPLRFKDATFIPTVTENGEYIFRVRETGRPEQIVKVDAVVGGGHMEGGGTQSFFTKFPDGTLRFVPFDYNRTNDVWFVQLADFRWVPISEEVSINNLANWPPHRVLGTSDKFSNCQNCHGSQILVEFDDTSRKYLTRYTTLQINCESCHGPGRKHIDLVKTADLDTLTDIGIVVLSTVSKDESLDKCFECHAEKAALTSEFLSGMPVHTHFALKFPILASEPYLPDGRIRQFAYQQNHIFSDCYINGSMTCVDCHEPHSQAYRDISFQFLPGKFHDGQCTDCHPSKAETPEHHSYHKPDSPGNVCTACHMPFLQHPLLGPSVRFARSDHVIPIPRPTFDAELGIENACQQCHQDKSIAWQQEKTDEWYRTIKPHNPLLSNNMKAKNVTDIQQAADLLLNAEPYFPAAQVTGIFDFIKRFLKPDMPSLSQAIIDRLKRLTESTDLDVKALAFVALHLSSDQREDIHAYLREKLHSFGEQEAALRYRWAFAIDYFGTLFTINRDYANAIRSHLKALEIKPSDPYTLLNLGFAYQNSQKYSDAIAAFKKAIEIEPSNANLYFQLAQTYTLSRQTKEAIEAVKKGLEYDPENPTARQMLRQLQS